MTQITRTKETCREIIVTTKYLAHATVKPKEWFALAFICPLLHLAITRAAHPASPEAWESTRTLSATLQWAILLLTTCVLSLNTTKWQLEENYASDLLTCTTPRRWLIANMLSVWAITIVQFAAHVLTLIGSTACHSQLTAIPFTHWAIYTINGALTLLTVCAAGTLFSLYSNKSAGFIFLTLILAAWINYIPEPWTYALPPIYLLDAKGLLVAAGSSASYSIQTGPWLLAVALSVVYAFTVINLTTNKLILAKLKS